jgi:hypothetical protein
MQRCAAFIAVAALTGVAVHFIVYRDCPVSPPGGVHRAAAIARADVEKTLSADDAARREAESLRAHRMEAKAAVTRVTKEQLVLGDISYGASEADVRARYGVPQEIETKRSERYPGKDILSYEYADGLTVHFVDGLVRRMKISERSSLSTEKGVRIGTTVEELRHVYGEPCLLYGDDHIYFSEDDPTVGIAFEAEHGHIEEIGVGDLGL